MAKQKQDNKTVDIELLILRDKIEELIDNYEYLSKICPDKNGKRCCKAIIKDLKGLLED